MRNNKIIHTFSILAYKESPYLEDCIKSCLNQEYPSKVIICTTTPNNYICNLAQKYNLEVIEGEHTNIGGDFDFAKNSAETELVTNAHQDDIYDKQYSLNICKMYNKYPDSSILFTDYYEIRNGEKETNNMNLKVKRFLLRKLKNRNKAERTNIKRSAIKYGDAISCPSVTFVKDHVPDDLFKSEYKANIDWFAWEKLSKMPGRFVYIDKPLMGHRISQDTETTKIINSGLRTQEDFEIYKKFWPVPVAKLFARGYRNSERSNKVK